MLGLMVVALIGMSPEGSTARAAEEPARRPNILIILADDMGYSDIGCFGGEIKTPNLDRLAASGLRFTRFYNDARCWPTRSSLLTGYYAQQIRMDPPKGRLPGWTRLLPHYLKPLGYRSYHSGKWHVNGAPKVIADGGFDHSYRVEDHNRNFYPRQHAEDDRPLPPVKPGTGYYTSTAYADFAIKCLREHARDHADAPFFQYLAFTAPHFPLQAPAEDIARYADRYSDGWDVIRKQRWDRQKTLGILDCALSARDSKTIPKWNLSEAELREQIGPGEAGHAVAWSDLTPEQKSFQASKMAIHAAMIDRMDQEIGRVLNQIEAMGALDNTLVVFASDNGASAEQIIRGDGHDPAAAPGSAQSFLCLGPGWSTASNTPFRLHKSWVHEGGISTPLIVSWPRGIAARGELRRDVGHVIDLVPTMLDLTGAHPSADWQGQTPPPLPGQSLVPAFTQDGTVKRDFLYFSHIGNRALRIGDWKLVSAKEFDNDWELYDLASDRAEMVNLAARHPDRVREMAARWTESDKLFHRQSETDAPATP